MLSTSFIFPSNALSLNRQLYRFSSPALFSIAFSRTSVLVGGYLFARFSTLPETFRLAKRKEEKSIEQCRHASLNIIDNIEWMSRFHGFKLNKRGNSRRPVALKILFFPFFFSPAMKNRHKKSIKVFSRQFSARENGKFRGFHVHCAGSSDKIAVVQHSYRKVFARRRLLCLNTNTDHRKSPPMTQSSFFLITQHFSPEPKQPSQEKSSSIPIWLALRPIKSDSLKRLGKRNQVKIGNVAQNKRKRDDKESKNFPHEIARRTIR